MKPGDMVRLRSLIGSASFYDWRSATDKKRAGFFLRDERHALLNGSLYSNAPICVFSIIDTGLVLNVDPTSDYVLILNPRNQTGLIYKDVVEVVD